MLNICLAIIEESPEKEGKKRNHQSHTKTHSLINEEPK